MDVGQLAAIHDGVPILAQTTITGSVTNSEIILAKGFNGFAFTLFVHTASLGATATLDVYIDSNLGTTANPIWANAVHFTQLTNTHDSITDQFEYATCVGTLAINPTGYNAIHDQSAAAKANLPLRRVRTRFTAANSPSVSVSLWAVPI
jgi:hypothetical protein